MIKSGICSVTLPEMSMGAVIELAQTAQLDGIEWWGGKHVPPGEVQTASLVSEKCEKAGISVAAYGSYYRAAESEKEGLVFEDVLATAVALGAPTIRVWAGKLNFSDASPEYIQAVVRDALRIADIAAEANISITFEYHGGTLTDRNTTAVEFSALVPHPNIYFSWQPPHGYTSDHCVAGLEGLLHRLSTIHVYHWTIGSYEKNIVNETVRPLVWPEDFYRHPLEDGCERWTQFLETAGRTERDHFALLEFVKNADPEQVVKDAATLRSIIAQLELLTERV